MIQKIKKKEIQITVLFITVFAIMMIGLLASIFYTESTKIGGVLYDEIMLSNSLTAEIMPPPMYVVEAYSIALEYIDGSNIDVRESLLTDFQNKQDTYNNRYEYWKENLPEDEDLRSDFLSYTYGTTKTFFDVFNNEVVPAIESGNEAEISTAKLNLISAYHEHRKAVDETVKLSEDWRQKTYSKANKIAETTKNIMIALVVFMFTVGVVFCVLISRSEKALFKLVFYDGLTGLPSRRNLIDRMEIIIAESKERNTEFAVVFFDLDGFKKVNDRLGHDAGDLLLKEAADCLEKLRNHQDILGRFGGDEFAMVLNRQLSILEIQEYLEKLKEGIKNLSLIKDTDIYLSASFGVSLFPRDGETYSELLKHADMAMYDAKHNGGNAIKFYQADRAQ